MKEQTAEPDPPKCKTPARPDGASRQDSDGRGSRPGRALSSKAQEELSLSGSRPTPAALTVPGARGGGGAREGRELLKPPNKHLLGMRCNAHSSHQGRSSGPQPGGPPDKARGPPWSWRVAGPAVST